MLKGQAGVEYAFISALIVSMVVLIAVPIFQEFELGFALENARRECVLIAGENNVVFAQLNYSISGRNVNLSPEFFYANGSVALEGKDLQKRPLHAIASAFHGTVDECVDVLNYRYCLLP